MTRRQYVIVARHGLRRDEVDSAWAATSKRPWDPPLADGAPAKVKELAAALHAFGIEKVITSPYQRCLETARTVCNSLNPQIHEVEVDNSLSEIAATPYFLGRGPQDGQPLEDWMWSGEAQEAGWKLGLGNIKGIGAGVSFPQPSETIASARQRYTYAIQAAADRSGSQNILLVSHGEAVGASVTRIHPTAQVQSVDHCGFTVAWRDTDEDGDWGFWRLEGTREGNKTGVTWADKTAS